MQSFLNLAADSLSPEILNGVGLDLSGFGSSPTINGRSSPSSYNRGSNKIFQRQDPLFVFDFRAEFPDLPSEFVEDITLPLDKVEAQPVFRSGTNVYYAGNYDISAITVKMYADINNTALKYLWKWRGQIHNTETGVFKPSNVYKRTISVRLLDATGKTALTFKFEGCFPTDIDALPMNSSSNERVTIGANLSVDGLTIEFGETGGIPISQQRASLFQSNYDLPTSIPINL